ncbi:bidirectional sugar transporter SWEET5-like [Benincasa hispida]|uniref:bidirectional sugar transporter SWEET5-like n=1 Tax=Benincasa hispida TaxID=102211 RepID=UPI001900426D|nr:bidirectional sugar transporter SWEET5-like [Benincasa hispida]
MVSATVARNIVGIIGNVISFGLFFSPVTTFYKIIKNKSVKEFKPDPYIATVLNCMFWIFYGMPFVQPDSMLVITINGVGLFIELVYLTIFVIFADNKGRKKVGICLLMEVIFVGIIVAITMIALHGAKNRSLMVGIICDIFNIMMYVSPLTIMKKVITTKSVKYMPFPLSLTNFLNGCVWTAYALIKFDLYMLISNGVGAISGFLQLILYGYYSVMDSKEDNELTDKDAKKIQLTNLNGSSNV